MIKFFKTKNLSLKTLRNKISGAPKTNQFSSVSGGKFS
jgi:hypothetical protein